MANLIGCVSQKGQSDFEKSEPDSPVSRVKDACEGAETSVFGFQNQFTARDGLTRASIEGAPRFS